MKKSIERQLVDVRYLVEQNRFAEARAGYERIIAELTKPKPKKKTAPQ